MKNKEYLKNIFNKENTVINITSVITIISMFIVPPDKIYLNYIDYKTILFLLSGLIIVTEFDRLNVFKILAEWIVGKFYIKHELQKQLYYIKTFTILNIIFLSVLLVFELFVFN